MSTVSSELFPETLSGCFSDARDASEYVKRVHQQEGFLFACDGRILVTVPASNFPDLDGIVGCTFPYPVMNLPDWMRSNYD